jgi:hypothetical protein
LQQLQQRLVVFFFAGVLVTALQTHFLDAVARKQLKDGSVQNQSFVVTFLVHSHHLLSFAIAQQDCVFFSLSVQNDRRFVSAQHHVLQLTLLASRHVLFNYELAKVKEHHVVVNHEN